MKFNKYKLNLFLNTFPSYSISAWFSSIFVQPRLFGLPFLITKSLKFKREYWNIFLFINLIICLIVPLFGLLFDRRPYFLDIAYIISSLYAILFVNKIVSNHKTIDLFNNFIVMILLLNILYILFQLILFYLGFPNLTMMHSNIPFHVESGYSISPGIISFIPRYTGLWIESGPLIFFLCLTFPYLLQSGIKFPNYLKFIIFTLIIFSQSKFLLIFVPFLFLEFFIKKYFPSVYKFSIKPGVFFFITLFFIATLLVIIFVDFQFHQSLSEDIPAYALRLDGIRNSLSTLLDFGPFGKGLLPSTIEMPDVKFSLQGLDVFSIVILGYGFIPGSILIFSILLIPVLGKFDYKYTFCGVLLFGFLSSGSLIVPQYLFAVCYSIVADKKNNIKSIQLN